MSVLKNKLKEKFLTVPQELITDKKLSNGAKVVYCYLVSKPDDWIIRNSDIMETLNLSKDTIAKYFKELITNGWIERKRQVDEHNQFTGLYDYIINETPKFSEIGKMPKSEDFRNRKNAEENTKIISPSNNIYPVNNIKTIKDNNINNNTNTKELNNNINNKYNINNNTKDNNYFVDDNIHNTYQIKLTDIDKQVYESFKEKLEKGTEKSRDGIDIPKTENDAKKVPKQSPKEEIGNGSKPKKKFVKPTIEQVKQYAIEANLTKLDPYTFYDHFESNGWKVSGISPMKDWKAAMRNWNRRSDSFNNTQQSNKNKNIFLEEYKRLEEEELNLKGE